MADNSTEQHSILVVGGGIAGLTAAIALRGKGFLVDVVEKDPDWTVYGVGIIQQANVVRAAAELGILEAYLESGFGFDHVKMFAPTGAQVAQIPSPRLADAGYPANMGVSRPALHKVLGDHAIAKGAKIFLGVTVTGIEEDSDGLDVTFSDGRTGRYAILVGADGLYSQIRGHLLPGAPKPEFTGQSVWRYNLPRGEDVDALHVYSGRIGAGLVPLSKDVMYIYVTSPEPGNPWLPKEGLAAAMRSRMAEAAPRVKQLAEQIVDDACVVYKPLEVLFVDGPWHKGRIVLIGDAVHATTPHLGQGAGMAIEDSIVLAEELSQRPEQPHEAFMLFQARRMERCRFIVHSSASVGEFQMGRLETLDYPALARQMFEVTATPL